MYGSANTYGVYGNGFYGVYGNSTHIGVYGNGTTYGLVGFGKSYGVYAGLTGSGGYAGYFVGNVYTTGSYSASDARLKKNIENMTSALDIIKKLNPKAYEFRQDGNYSLMNLPKGKHYGIMAQELEAVFPSMVADTKFDVGMAKQNKEFKHGAPNEPNLEQQAKETIDYKAVNYTELIPVLVKAVQEQQQTIEGQQKRIEQLEAKVNKLSGGNSAVSLTKASLGDASPNPVNGSAIVSYNLPVSSRTAHILITDIKGSIIKQVNIGGNGSGQVQLNTASLAAGTYTYSLFVDGAKVDTKQLLVAR